MLFMDEDTRRRLRGVQDTWLQKNNRPKPKPAPSPRKLNRDKRRHLVDTVARLMKAAKESGAAATLLNFEGPCRHSLRSRLCLEGWPWQDADNMAADIVGAALRQIGAQRPTWAEGQPEWSQIGAGTIIERTRCAHCGGPLPEENRKFCSEVCSSVARGRLTAIRHADETKVHKLLAGHGKRWSGFDR